MSFEIEEVYKYFEYLSLLLALVFYTKYKGYSFYKFFVLFLLNSLIFSLIALNFKSVNNHELFNIYTFFEFNIFTLLYYHLISNKRNLAAIKILAILFNVLYLLSFFIKALQSYSVPFEALLNSVFRIIYFKE